MSSSSALFSPVDNLFSSIIALLFNPANPIKLIGDIMSQSSKDEHGNILIALDDKNMSLWRAGLQQLVPNTIFKPVMFVTNPDVIKVLLSELKSDSKSHFAGNPSTDTIGSMVGNDNIFASTHRRVHGKHKLAFKNYLSDKQANVALIAPVIQSWIMTMSGRCISDMDFELLAASIMLTFLLDRELAFDSQCVADIITFKKHFVRTATMSDGIARFFDGYKSAGGRLQEAIIKRWESNKPSYIKSLSTDFELYEVCSHILSLMAVGFDNLRSSLISTVIHLAKHPEYRTILNSDMHYVGENKTAFLDFELTGRDNAASMFFAEAIQQAPPVWLQARVNKAEATIEYSDDKGKHSFTLPSAALVLIPNLHLVLANKREAKKSAELFPHPFSMGPNACPGRQIAYAANGLLIASIISKNLGLALSSDSSLCYDPKVALSFKNLKIDFGSSVENNSSYTTRHQVIFDFDMDNTGGFVALSLAVGFLTSAVVSVCEKDPASLSIILSLAAIAMLGLFGAASCHYGYEKNEAASTEGLSLAAPRLS